MYSVATSNNFFVYFNH